MEAWIYAISFTLLLYGTLLGNAQSCTGSSESGQCTTFGPLCECSNISCIPTTNPCGPSTTDIVFLRSFFLNIPRDAFLSYNNITFLAIAGFVGLSIEQGAFNGLHNLEILRVNAFSISASSKSWATDIDMYVSYSTGLTGLQAVSQDMFNTLPRLKSLDLSFNRINYVNRNIFSSFYSVEELGLAGNSIEMFDETAFKPAPRLKKLYMSKNRISHLVFMTNSSHSLFQHLERLDLFGNGITVFPSFILQIVPPVVDIDLRENPLICDCNMIEFLKSSSEDQQIVGLDPTCTSPEKICSAPKISSSFTEFEVLPGESVLLAFEVTGQPHPFVSISGPDGLQRVGRYNIKTNQVTVDLLIAEDTDFGTYTCSAQNSYGSTSSTVVVKKEPTKHITTTKSAKSKKANNANSLIPYRIIFLLIAVLHCLMI
ncbi:SLIT and NTRK-like protein 3 [Anneissia japonica]|uniref:SLIT and NTRK-like protein 3 n=1 Tax=Anneissia japonica TaxID=1529436 RepID=UPI0014256D77|nr:SLIT and NTRK-like protein 3 [Anneissia japonica]